MQKETISVRFSKKNSDVLDKLRKLADKDNRTLNNYIQLILLEWVKKKGK